MSQKYELIISIALLLLLITSVDGIEIKVYNGWLVDQDNLCLYYLLSDNGNRASTCFDECLGDYVPFPSETFKDLSVISPLKESDFEYVKRSDGKYQVIYKGWPLYSYKRDKPNERNGVSGMWGAIYTENFPPY